LETGVLDLDAVSDNNDPTSITFLEIYSNQCTYLSHLKNPHYLTYKTGTSEMVRSLELVKVDAFALGSKEKIKLN
jgi:quinol monooxygenase YgiN